MTETVCAVVVTYNRRELLMECLAAIRKQTRPVQDIYIVDNASTDDTPALLLEKGYIKELPPVQLSEPWEREFQVQSLTEAMETVKIKIHYVRMHENTGGAGGFHEGVKRGYERGYDWLWLMDDDGRPQFDCLSKLLTVGKRGFDYVAPNLLDENGVSHFQERFKYARTPIINFRGGPFNAILISRNLVQAVGYPMKNFFIWGDEYEYCNRIQEAGFPVVTVQHAIHHHKRTTINYRTCNRGYYLVRNRVYQYRLYRGVYRSKLVHLMGIFVETTKFLFNSFRALNLHQVGTALYGFVRGWLDPLHDAQKQCYWWGERATGSKSEP